MCYYKSGAVTELAVQILMRLEVDLASLAPSNDLRLKLPLLYILIALQRHWHAPTFANHGN